MTRCFHTMERAACLLVLALLMLLPDTAWAHPMPSSEVLLDIQEKSVALELRLPLSELEVGFEHPLANDPYDSFAHYKGELRDYVVRHLAAQASDGRAWNVQVQSVSLSAGGTVPELIAQGRMEPPAGASLRRFTLLYDVIMHRLVTHVALVSVRRDWNGGVVSGTPHVLGEIRYYKTHFPVDVAQGSAWQGFFSVVHLGMQHIAEGTDHLLFLLVLLLPASLRATNGLWKDVASVRQSVRTLLKIVTAFTLGHSLTLIAGAAGWVHAPSRPIETLIALSIFVSALHALRPIFPGREAFVAAGFGLVHGLAFAGVVAEFRLDTWHTVLAIFGFNAGIECMQLLVVAATVPWLLLLARTRAYSAFRVSGAVFAGSAALGWMAERALGWNNPLGVCVERAASHGIEIVVGLAVCSITAVVYDRYKRLLATGKPPDSNAVPAS